MYQFISPSWLGGLSHILDLKNFNAIFFYIYVVY